LDADKLQQRLRRLGRRQQSYQYTNPNSDGYIHTNPFHKYTCPSHIDACPDFSATANGYARSSSMLTR
jgi:hypothetical protein